MQLKMIILSIKFSNVYNKMVSKGGQIQNQKENNKKICENKVNL